MDGALGVVGVAVRKSGMDEELEKEVHDRAALVSDLVERTGYRKEMRSGQCDLSNTILNQSILMEYAVG